jgi:DNA polymerase III delta prime subunit
MLQTTSTQQQLPDHNRGAQVAPHLKKHKGTNMFNEEDFLPQTLDECVISDVRSKDILASILNGSMPFPAFGKCGILLHGNYGTGKTTTSCLLPELIEKSRGGSNAMYDLYRCAQGMNGVSLINNITQRTSFISLNQSGLHYSILDEVDNLTQAAQASLKAIMDGYHGIFIMTTNDISKIDKGVVNRSHVINMLVAKSQSWLPLVKRVITSTGATCPPDASLLPIITSCNGSGREILTVAMKIASQSIRKGATNV